MSGRLSVWGQQKMGLFRSEPPREKKYKWHLFDWIIEAQISHTMIGAPLLLVGFAGPFHFCLGVHVNGYYSNDDSFFFALVRKRHKQYFKEHVWADDSFLCSKIIYMPRRQHTQHTTTITTCIDPTQFGAAESQDDAGRCL
jgi:hypothetical protein